MQVQAAQEGTRARSPAQEGESGSLGQPLRALACLLAYQIRPWAGGPPDAAQLGRAEKISEGTDDATAEFREQIEQASRSPTLSDAWRVIIPEI